MPSTAFRPSLLIYPHKQTNPEVPTHDPSLYAESHMPGVCRVMIMGGGMQKQALALACFFPEHFIVLFQATGSFIGGSAGGGLDQELDLLLV